MFHLAVTPWLLLALGLASLACIANAHRPRYAPGWVAFASFFAGWLTVEAALHHLAWQLAASAALLYGGALDAWPGVVGLLLTAAGWPLLWRLYFQGDSARAAFARQLAHLPALPSPLELRQLLFPLPVTHPGVERIRHLPYARYGERTYKLDVCRPRRAVRGAPALLYVHGGAWVIGDKNKQGLALTQHLAARGWVCFSIDYRLSPRATFPEHLIDVKRAIAWIRDHGAEYGADPGFIVIAGGSAGGHLASLAALTANDPEYQPGFETVDTRLAGCVSIYGVYDLADRAGHFRNDHIRRILERKVMKVTRAAAPAAYDRASPLTRIHAGAPPFLIVHGDRDSLVPVASARAFAEALRGAGAPHVYVELPGAQHAFELFPSLRTAHFLRGAARFCDHLWQRACQPAEPKKSSTHAAVARGASAETSWPASTMSW